MWLQEQIYTSAAALLEGGGNLGVVARTRAFPADVAAELATLRSYTPLPGLPPDQPDRHPPRLVGSPRANGVYYSLSRIAHGGFDHTGRTTPLAHHVVVATADTRAAHAAPAGLLAAVDPLFVRRHEGPPRWIDPPRQVDVRPITPDAPLARVAAAVFAFATFRRPAVVVVDPSADPVPVVVGVLSLLPPSVAWATAWATHVIDAADYVRDAALVLTYPGTPLLEQCRFRKDGRAPLVFDPAGPPPAVDGPSWATVIGDGDPDRAADACRRWEAAGLTPGQLGEFVRVSSLVDALSASTAGDVHRLGIQLAVPTTPNLERWSAEAAVGFVRRLADEPAALAAVASSSGWPAAARSAAVDVAVARAESGDAAAVAALAGAGPSVAGDVRRRVATSPDVVPFLVQLAADSGQAERLTAAVYLLGVGPVAMRDALNMAERVPTMGPSPLADALVRAVADGLTDHPAVEALQHAITAGPAFCRAVVVPALRRRLEQVPPGPLWTELHDGFVSAAVVAGDVAAQATWCINRFADQLRPADVRHWLVDDRVPPADRDAVRRAAATAGIDLSDPVAGPAVHVAAPVPILRPVRATPGGAGWSWWASLILLAIGLAGVATEATRLLLSHNAAGHAVGRWATVIIAGLLWATSGLWARPLAGRRWLAWVMPAVLAGAAVVGWAWVLGGRP